jgi:integrase
MSTSDQTTGRFPTSSAIKDTRSDLHTKQKESEHVSPKREQPEATALAQRQAGRQKPPLKLKEIWEIRIRLRIDEKHRELALFNLAIDSKLRACDLLGLRVSDVSQGNRIASRAAVVQQKTSQSVQFEITEQTRQAVSAWIQHANLGASDFLFPSRIHKSPHLSTRQYARIVESWVVSIGLDPAVYGTHSMRRTKASLVYRRTKNLRAVQLMLGHTKFESTVRYPGIEVDDALELAEQTEV